MRLSCVCYVLLLAAACMVVGCGADGVVIRHAPSRSGLQESLVQSDAGWFISDKIAVIDVDGILRNRQESGLFSSGENPVSLFCEKLNKAACDNKVKAVVLRINSPGGTVAASDTMYHMLSEFRKKTHKPVVACMLGVAASGGYYLACGCDTIIAGPTTVTGSIGTMMQTVSFAGTMDKIGIKAEAIKSSDLKDLASPLHDLRPEERKVLQEIITHFYNQFLDVVLAGRKGLDRQGLLKLADGRVFTAKNAKEASLIDHIGYPDDAITIAKQLANLDRVEVVMYHRPMGHKSNIYASAEPTTAQALLVNIQLPIWLRQQGTQFLYLWYAGQ